MIIKINANHFELQVTDAYRWLENPETDERKIFIKEQNSVTKNYINSNPYRTKIRKG